MMNSGTLACPFAGCTIVTTATEVVKHIRERHRSQPPTPAIVALITTAGGVLCPSCNTPYMRSGLRAHQSSSNCTAFRPELHAYDQPQPPAAGQLFPAHAADLARQLPADRPLARAANADAPAGAPRPPVPAPRPAAPGPWLAPTATTIAIHGALVDNVPPEMINQWKAAFQVITGPYMVMTTPQTKARPLTNLLLLPGASLARKRGGRAGLRSLRAQLGAFTRACTDGRDAPRPMPRPAEARAAGPAPPPPLRDAASAQQAHNIKAAEAFLERGLLSRATHALARTTLADMSDPRTMEQLRALHPQSDEYANLPPVPANTPRTRLDVRDEQLARNIRHWLSNGSSGGPSGLTGAHLLPLLDDQACYANLVAILTDIVNGDVDPAAAPLLLSSRLIPGSKPNGSIRPIAVGEVLTRLAGLVAVDRVTAAATTIFGDVQLGCGAPGGSQSASLLVHTALHAGLAVFTIDIANAFNTRSRLAIIQRLFAHDTLSPLFRMAHLVLSHASPLLIVNFADADGTPLTSTHGVRQGCTLAGLLFALSIHEHLCQVPASVAVCAIQDDISLCGAPDDTAAAATQLKARLTSDGDLKLNADKEEVFWAGSDVPTTLRDYVNTTGCRLVLTNVSDDDLPATASALDDPSRATNEATLLGVPIGQRAAARAVKRMTRNRNLFDALDDILLPAQSVFLLLRVICNSFGTYLARTLHPDDSRDAMVFLDQLVDRIVRQRLELTPSEAADDIATRQVRLKLKDGGLGFQNAEATRFVAFWAAAAQGASLLNSGPLHAQLLTSSWLRSALATCWASSPMLTLRSSSATAVMPTTCDADAFTDFYRSRARPRRSRQPALRPDVDPDAAAAADHERIPAEKLQRVLSAHLCGIEASAFKTSPSLPPEGRTRIQSATGPGAVLWLSTCPSEPIRRFTNLDFACLVRLRLGLTPIAGGPTHCSCRDSPALAAAPSHTLSCQHLRATATESVLVARHDLIKLHLATLLRLAGHRVSVEPQDLDQFDRSRPDLSVSDMRGKEFLLDTTVVNPTCDSAGNNMTTTENKAATAKTTKYSAMAAQQHATFIPLVFNVYGHWHPLVDALLAADAGSPRPAFSALSHNAQMSHQQWRVYSSTVLSCALQRGNATVLQVAAQNIRSSLIARARARLPRPAAAVAAAAAPAAIPAVPAPGAPG